MSDSKRILHANQLVVNFLEERAQYEPALSRHDVHEIASSMLYSATRAAQELNDKTNVNISDACAYLPLEAMLSVASNKQLRIRERLLVRNYLKTLPGMNTESIKAGKINHPEAQITHTARMMAVFGA